ncbi:hypothetical protein INR49_025053 [Caranx melampygus]|nr:hypothetical protein INR49_025053 [Caranx melampygus]
MSELEDVSLHIQLRISSLHRLLDLSAAELPQGKMEKLGQEIFALERLLEMFEKCVQQQKEQLSILSKVEIEQSLEKDLNDVQHMRDNIPAHMPRSKDPARGNEPVMKKKDEAADVQTTQAETVRKPKTQVRVMEFITMPEFDGQYFVVEDDIREFTQSKVDKRFQGILNMLRHCQRLKELRGGGVTRYMLL